MASNKKSYDGAHDYKQELKSDYRHSERFETDTCHTKLKLMKRKKLKHLQRCSLFDPIYLNSTEWKLLEEKLYGGYIDNSDDLGSK